jgi:hypothetical protein
VIKIPLLWVLLFFLALGFALGMTLYTLLLDTRLELLLLRIFRANNWPEKRWQRFLKIIGTALGLALSFSFLAGWKGAMVGVGCIPLLFVEWWYNRFNSRLDKQEG